MIYRSTFMLKNAITCNLDFYLFKVYIPLQSEDLNEKTWDRKKTVVPSCYFYLPFISHCMTSPWYPRPRHFLWWDGRGSLLRRKILKVFGFVKDYAFCMIQQYVKECWVAQGKRRKWIFTPSKRMTCMCNSPDFVLKHSFLGFAVCLTEDQWFSSCFVS